MTTYQLPLHQDTMENLLTIVYVSVDDALKAAARSGLFHLPHETHQKATSGELMTIALVDELLSLPSQEKWLLQVRFSSVHCFLSCQTVPGIYGFNSI